MRHNPKHRTEMTTTEALVIAGHGSHRNPDSAAPVFAHADTIRKRGIFDEVREAFWKEEPSFREVLRTLESDVVYVVPLFMSEGYFTERVMSRELRLTDDWTLDVDKQVHYTSPVGTHDAMTDVILRRAETVTGDPAVGAGYGLALVGHGTERHEGSGGSTQYHAARIRDRDRFDEVRALFMDEPPYVDGVTEHFEAGNVILVPLFVADGYHTREDIPEDIGLTDDYRTGYDVPATVDGHRLWYSGAVGTESLLVEVILERAAKAGASIETGRREDRATPGGRGQQAFCRWLEYEDRWSRDERLERLSDGVSRSWGQLHITTSLDDTATRIYEIRHEADVGIDRDHLDVYTDPHSARAVETYDEHGQYRPLKTAPTLPTGWVFVNLTARDLVQAVERFYPATVANWALERDGTLDVTHWQAVTDRQTGLYDVVDELPSEAVEWATQACCVDSQCLKRREWDLDESEELDVPRGDGEFPCREACSLFVAAAREFALVERDSPRTWEVELTPSEKAQLDALVDGVSDGRLGAVRDGDLDDETNRYRVRYLRAKRFGDGGLGGP